MFTWLGSRISSLEPITYLHVHKIYIQIYVLHKSSYLFIYKCDFYILHVVLGD